MEMIEICLYDGIKEFFFFARDESGSPQEEVPEKRRFKMKMKTNKTPKEKQNKIK